MAALAPDRLSDLIGMIYDCAIEPGKWTETIAEVCTTLDCLSGLIVLIDLHRSRHRLAYAWGMNPGWEQSLLKHGDIVSGFYQRAFSRAMCPDGEPQILSGVIEAAGPRGQAIYEQLTRPLGISEAMQTVVLRQAGRLAVFGANRHEAAGALTDREREIMRLFVPHIRRAVAISDMLDVKKLEAHTLAATLDAFATGVVLIADQCRIVHANDAARRMLSKGPVTGTGGYLRVRNAAANNKLTEAIALAQRDEARIGASGLGVALNSPSGEPTVAHVLPLARGDLRTQLMPQATAAVFIAPADVEPELDISAVANTFCLTPAEARTLQRLLAGATIAETADTLGVSTNTARTHLARIFSKTGVSRQADLVALINRLVPPVRRPINE